MFRRLLLGYPFFIFSPLSFAIGSPGLWFSQPVADANLPLGGLWVLIIDAIVEIVALLTSKHPCLAPDYPGLEAPPGSVKMTVPELAAFLKQLKNGVQDLPIKQSIVPGEIKRPGVQIGAPIWFTVFILLSGFVEKGEGAPRISLFVPLFEFKGITGGLPILIIGLIATILIRSVVPPKTSGIEPIPEPTEEPKYELKLQEILHLLRRFGSNFK